MWPAAALGQSGGAYETEIQIYRTDSEEMADSVSFGGELIYDLTFADEKRSSPWANSTRAGIRRRANSSAAMTIPIII